MRARENWGLSLGGIILTFIGVTQRYGPGRTGGVSLGGGGILVAYIYAGLSVYVNLYEAPAGIASLGLTQGRYREGYCVQRLE